MQYNNGDVGVFDTAFDDLIVIKVVRILIFVRLGWPI